jgi:phosphoglycerate dehydrogenase-like enzyme
MPSSPPSVYVALVPDLFRRFFGSETDQQLRRCADLTFNTAQRNPTSSELAAIIGSYDAVISGWGTPAFTPEVLAKAGKLRLLAHAAGSVKHLVKEDFFARGLSLTHAAAAMAPAVAESSLLMTMMLLRRLPRFMDAMRSGKTWQEAGAVGYGTELAATRVGVVGAGYTGRHFIKMLRALDAEVWVYDPFLTDARAAELGARKVELGVLLKGCPVVSLQAPSTPQTHHMIGRNELAMLQDGAIFINTARSWLTDEAALLAELKTGRITAALDVFDQEPLPTDSPYRSLPNVYLTPHIAGASKQTDYRIGKVIADEIERFFASKPLQYPVTAAMLSTMA